MNISEVRVKLSGNDILSIINEFVKVDGLNLKSLSINNGIILEGSFKKVIKIDFLIKAELIECIENKIVVRIAKVKVFNFGIFRIFRSFALKQLSKAFKEYGIASKKDKVIIDIKTVLKDVPFVDLNIEDIFIKKSEVWIEASKIDISVAGELIKKVKEKEEKEENDAENILEALEITDKVEDNYSKGRKTMEGKLPISAEKYKDYVFMVPDIISLIYRLLKDKRVPVKTKLTISAAIGYVTIQSDMIPDKIPFIGKIDDVGIIFFALNKIFEDVPLSVIIENWQGKNELILVLKQGSDYLSGFTKAGNVKKIYEVIEELSTL